MAGDGSPLDAETGAFFAARFGREFGGVRVHTGAAADRSARAVDALAYTVGRDVVFRAGTYAPASAAGKRLLAHELTHVAQQEDGGAPRLSPSSALEVGRADDPLEREAERIAASVTADAFPPRPLPGQGTAGRGPLRPGVPVLRRAPPAAAAPVPAAKPLPGPRLEVRKSVDAPCACLAFVHNDEQNARRTAELMHEFCAYNLAIITPDQFHRRNVTIRGASKDPNELFPAKIAAACRADRVACEADVAANAAAPTLESTQKQFFLMIDKCSEGFSIPVVALHNNSIDDTRAFDAKRQEMLKQGKDPFAELPRDIDKDSPGTSPQGQPADPVAEMKAALKKHFDLDPLTETGGKTNIFRWCASKDIGRCHIGDPDHPDNVVWVTHERDFETLRASGGVNVALQTRAARGGESEKDLSTLFLTVTRLIREAGRSRTREIWSELASGGLSWEAFWDVTERILSHGGETAATLERVRYINIETPGDPKMASAAHRTSHRVEQYEAIVATLKALGLHCCFKDPEGGEAAVADALSEPVK